MTVRFAVALTLVVPVCVDVIELTVFVLVPSVVESVTLTLTAQVPAMAIVPPVNDTVPEPAVAATVEPPPQVLVTPGVAATTRPPGNVSVKATPVSASVLAPGLARLKVNVLVTPSAIVVGPNTLVRVGGVAALRLADAVFPVPPLVELTARVVLLKVPAIVAVTFTVIVQLAFALTPPPISTTLVEPAVAVTVPPQLSTSPLGVATTRFAGKLSVNPRPASAAAFAQRDW